MNTNTNRAVHSGGRVGQLLPSAKLIFFLVFEFAGLFLSVYAKFAPADVTNGF